MHSTRTHHTPNAFTPKLRSNHQISRNWPASKSSVTLKGVQKADHSRNPSSFLDSRYFVCLTCQKCVFNANHNARVTKFLKEVNSRVKAQPLKTRNTSKPIEQKSHTQTPIPQILTGHRWVPTGKIFTSSTTKADSEPPNGSKEDIINPYKCEHTLNVSAGLVPNPPSPTPVASPVPTVVAPDSTDLTSLPSSNTIDQDAPSLSTSQTPQESQSPVIPSGVEEKFHDIEVAHLDNDPFFGVLIPEPIYEESSLRDVIPTNVHSVNQPPEHLKK
ncbi:hypothetical protein Tco_0478028 [Tanacetum coccineum]